MDETMVKNWLQDKGVKEEDSGNKASSMSAVESEHLASHAPATLAKPTHERTVSWGDHGGKPPFLPRSPELKSMESLRRPSDFSAHSSPKSDITTPALDSRSFSNDTSDVSNHRHLHQQQHEPITLAHVLQASPLEAEAETQILKAIEKTKRGPSSRAIFTNIPDESADLFSGLPDEEEHDEEEDPNDAPNDTTSPSTRQPNQTHHQQPHHQQHRRETIGSRSSAGSGLPKSKWPKLHKRTKTSEDTLAGLTMALKSLNSPDKDAHPHQQAQNPERPKPSRSIADPSLEVGSGGALAHNVGVIFRGPANGTSSQDDQTHAAVNPGSKWGFVKAAVEDKRVSALGDGAPKKSQNRFLDVVTAAHKFKVDGFSSDVELGMEGSDDDIDERDENGVRRKKKHSCMDGGILKDFQIFLQQRRSAFFNYVRLMVFLVLPALGAAILLFYVFENPPTGIISLSLSGNGIYVNDSNVIIEPYRASASWWIIFICIRQVLTFSMAQLVQVIVVDYMCLSTRWFVAIFGNLVTILIVQAKGWPFIVFVWGLLNFGINYGAHPFAQHWLYWQRYVRLFNGSNFSGSVTESLWYTRVLSVAVSVGFFVALKRLWLGLYLGKKTYANFSEELTKVMKQVLILTEIGALARQVRLEEDEYDQVQRAYPMDQFGVSNEEFSGMVRTMAEHEDAMSESVGNEEPTYSEDTNKNYVLNPEEEGLNHGHKIKMNELLGAWEDPDDEYGVTDEHISVKSILQFRRSLSYLDSRFMFSLAWGDVGNRERCVYSSQEVYSTLLKRSPNRNVLKFDVLALMTRKRNGSLDTARLKDLIRLIRPDRDGTLPMLEFVKSVDSVFKRVRLLQASVRNSETIDKAFETTVNVAFYVTMVSIILSQVGLDPFALFLALSPIIISFAWMIGSASAKMFDGMLFVLIRRPYGIGDRIHISDVNSDTSSNGSASWIVKDVTLFHTTAVFAVTNERCTMANGSLANSRVINMARSPNGTLFVFLKFPIDISYEKLQIFEQALRHFVKARPREWVSLAAFRISEIRAELGYVEYIVVLSHRDSWQNVGALLTSKGEVTSFCHELSKKLEMGYKSPTMPIELSMNNRSQAATDSITAKFANFDVDDDSAVRDVVALFEKDK